MRNTYFFLLTLLMGLFFSSCIKDEALNTEADIVTAKIPENLIKLPVEIENDFVTFYVNGYADITQLAPEFTLTEGATINPASGTIRDFTNPQFYTVTSQNGAYSKTYKISVYTAEISSTFSFENTRIFSNGGFYEWIEVDGDKEAKIWDSGNSGFYLSFLTDPQNRPDKDHMITTIEPQGKIGQGVRLETQKTGKMGQAFAAIAAGNLFTGKFETNITKPEESPRFGTNWEKAPTKLTGYFKYKKGEKFEIHSKDGQSNLTEDTFDIYAIYFKKDSPNDYLKATHDFRFIDNPQDDPRILSYARIKPEDRIETEQWTYFELPFITIAGRAYNPDDEYMLAIVLTSSLEGDKYNGAIGSRLSIDEIEVLTDQEINN
ncbi:PCMD domain-containing protein [Myroides sp. 1354]|nr:PCMD domain-containing protein [Myroides sp. R163-1]MDM1054400.1 PCMD domain-containing protein [Myroides sp. 1354]MDM1067696.1 PCMD domain-containing protein [Myroides sp. 1372]